MKRLMKISLIGFVSVLIFTMGAYAVTIVPKIFVNSNEVKSSEQPKIIDGSVYVPIRTISDGFGTDITWDNKTKTVYINSDPLFKMEEDRTVWVSRRNKISRFIMAYDGRDYEAAMEEVSDNFTTDIYLEFPTGGYTDMLSIIDYKLVGYEDDKFTMQIVKRPYAEEYNIKVEEWEFIVKNRIESVEVVPGSTRYLERYTVVPNATFGQP